MIKSYTTWPKFGLCIVVLMNLLSSLAFAELPFDRDRDTDVGLRAQGRADLCYAFAEEQLIKDFTCTRHCDLDARQWKFSIFGIAKAHQEKWVKEMGASTIKGNLTADLFANGSSYVFPYEELGVNSLSASHCTLERETFFLNRSEISNPNRLEMQDYLRDQYSKLRNGLAPSVSDADLTELQPTLDILESLAGKASSPDDFLDQVIAYKKCNDRIPVPKFSVKSKTLSDPSAIASLVESLLNQKKTLYVGVCAEVIQAEKDDDSLCGRHAVVLKSIRKVACPNDQCDTEIQVIDSALFSLRTKNQDGSVWLPAAVVIHAMEKSAKDFERIQERTMHNAESSDVGADLAKALKDYLTPILRSTSSAQFKSKVLSALTNYFSKLKSDPKTMAMIAPILPEVAKLQLESLADLDRLKEAVKRGLITGMKSNTKTSAGNGIVWLEQAAIK